MLTHKLHPKDFIVKGNNTSDDIIYSGALNRLSLPDYLPITSDELRIITQICFIFVINPIFSVFGLVANIASGVIIFRSGLRKTANIFLLALAIADCACMFRGLNVGVFFTYARNRVPLTIPGWEMSFDAAFLCFVLYKITMLVSDFGAMMSSAVTVLITVDRFVAIFYPFKFSCILTPKRAWRILFSVSVCVLPVYIFKTIYKTSGFKFFVVFNSTIGQMTRSVFSTQHSRSLAIFEQYFVNQIEVIAPLAIVSVGCIAMSVKLACVQRNMKHVVHNARKHSRMSGRTTRTLLSVCLVFALTRVLYLFIYLPIFDDRSPKTRNTSLIFREVRWSLIELNSSCNIFVYVTCNCRFKGFLKSFLVTKCWRGMSHSRRTGICPKTRNKITDESSIF